VASGLVLDLTQDLWLGLVSRRISVELTYPRMPNKYLSSAAREHEAPIFPVYFYGQFFPLDYVNGYTCNQTVHRLETNSGFFGSAAANPHVAGRSQLKKPKGSQADIRKEVHDEIVNGG
jgi:hypothetical protein